MADRDVAKASSATRVSSTSTSYQDALTLTWTPATGSKDYWLIWSALVDRATTSSDTLVRLYDSTGAAELSVLNIEPSDTTDVEAVFGLAKWTSPSTPVSQSFILQYAGETGATVSGLDDMTIVAIESHASDQYVETLAEQSTFRESYQDRQTLTFTPAASGDYLIIASAEFTFDGTSDGGVRLTVDGVASHEVDPQDQTDSTNYIPWLAVHKVTLDASSHTIKIQNKTPEEDTAAVRRRRILAIRLDTLRLASSTYTAGTTSSTDSSNMVDTALTTFTAEASTDYFVLGNQILYNNSNSFSTKARIRYGSTNFALTLTEPRTSGNQQSYFALGYTQFSAGSIDARVQYSTETASRTVTAKDRGIYVLDLREAIGPTTYEESVTEALAIVDAFASQGVFGVSLSEAVVLTDTIAGGLLIAEAVSEALGLADAFSGSLTIGEALSEAMGMTDVGASQAVLGSDVSETLATSDSPVGNAIMGAAVSETVGLTETTAGGLLLLESLSEALGVADAVSAALTIPAAISEALALTDAAASLAVLSDAISEALGLTDAAAGALTLQASIAEALAVTDAATAGKLISEAVTEALSLKDTAAANAAMQAAIAELVSLTDAAQTQAIFASVIAENIGLADFIIGAREINLAIAETLGVSDAVAAAILTIVVLTGTLRIRPALAGTVETDAALVGTGRLRAGLQAEIETRARIAATATRLRAALAGKVNLGD
jgi:hypothetical protein